MIHVRTKEFLLVVVVVVVVETLCLRRFVYRHKGVNHRQAAVESVKEGERGKKRGRERGRERVSRSSSRRSARCHRLAPSKS